MMTWWCKMMKMDNESHGLACGSMISILYLSCRATASGLLIVKQTAPWDIPRNNDILPLRLVCTDCLVPIAQWRIWRRSSSAAKRFLCSAGWTTSTPSPASWRTSWGTSRSPSSPSASIVPSWRQPVCVKKTFALFLMWGKKQNVLSEQPLFPWSLLTK